MEAVKELEGKLKERQDRLHAIFEEAGPEMDMSKVTTVEGDSEAKVQEIRNLNDEMTDLAKQIEEKGELVAIREHSDELDVAQDHPGHPAAGKGKTDEELIKSIGEHIIDSGAAGEHKGKAVEIEVDGIKTLFETGTGWGPESTRGPRVVELAQRPLDVLDLIPQTTTQQTSVVYMEETTYTNAAAETAEGAAKSEAALALTEKDSPVRKIAVWLPVTDEQLEDVPQARQYINNRLPFMVRQRLNNQILVGNGTAPNLRGLLNIVGIQTQAKGTDPTPDAVYKAMTKVRSTGRAIPGAAVFNPLDWQDVRLLRTADGIYIWGSPADAGPERIWGMPVALADITENTALVGDFANFTELAVRKNVEVKISDSHADFFVANKQAIRAECRAALVVYRPTALCTVTGV